MTTWAWRPWPLPEIIRVLIVNAAPITNGSLGIKGIPSHATLLVCYGWGGDYANPAGQAVLQAISGNILRCIRDNEIAASVIRHQRFQYKVLSFCIGAVFAGIGGGLLGSHLSTIDPKMFNFLLTFNVLMFVVARRARLAYRQHTRRDHHHHPAGMAPFSRGADGYWHNPDSRHSRNAHGRVFRGFAGHYPQTARRADGHKGAYLEPDIRILRGGISHERLCAANPQI